MFRKPQPAVPSHAFPAWISQLEILHQKTPILRSIGSRFAATKHRVRRRGIVMFSMDRLCMIQKVSRSYPPSIFPTGSHICVYFPFFSFSPPYQRSLFSLLTPLYMHAQLKLTSWHVPCCKSYDALCFCFETWPLLCC